MIAGCIPVFVGSKYDKPFEDMIPYDSFSYHFNGTNYMNGNAQMEVDKLWNVSQEDIEVKRDKMARYIRFIDWRHGNSTFEAILESMFEEAGDKTRGPLPKTITETKVSCGSHEASTCAECPQGNGAGWCNGDCEWSNVNGGVCLRKISHVSCGSHEASTCAECPQGNGAGWCNGDCEWSSENGGVCQSQTGSFNALKYLNSNLKSTFEQPIQPITSPTHKPLIFGAGEGTTATHAIYDATCKLGFRSVHWEKSCNHNAGHSNKKPPPGVLAHFDLIRTYKRIMVCATPDWNYGEEYECPTVNQTLHVMLDRINQVIASPGIDAIHDAPYPNFAEYVLNTTKKIRGRKPIVVLSERNPQDWTKRRIQQHPSGLACRGNDIGTNLYRCLKSAIQAGLGSERINKILYKFNEPGTDTNLMKGFELHQNNMRKVSVYHTNLFERNPRIGSSKLAKEIGYATGISFRRNLGKKYWDLSLKKGNDGTTADCTVSIPNDDDDASNSATPSAGQYMVHVHGFHHTGTGFTRHMLDKSLSSLSPELLSSMHDSGGIASQEEGQHLQSVYPTDRQRYEKCEEVESSSLDGKPLRMSYQYLDSCKINSPETVGRTLFNQWAPFWNTSASFLLQKTPTLDVQFLETVKIMPTLHVLVIRHPMVSGIIDPHATLEGCGGFAYSRSLDISYWTEAWAHSLSVLNREKNEDIWYAVLTYEALVQHTDQVMTDLMEVVKRGLKRYGGGHLLDQTGNETDGYSKVISNTLRRRLEYHSNSGSTLSPNEEAITKWNGCLKLPRCSTFLNQLTLDVLPKFGYVSANNTTLSSKPGTVMVSEDFGHVLFSSEGKASSGLGDKPSIDLLSTMRKISKDTS